MGSVFVERFVAAGIKPLVFDVSPAAVDHARELGAEPCSSALELAQKADIVDVMVRTDAEMLDCVLGDHGILSGLSAGDALVLHSTVHPRTTRKIAEAAGAKRVAIADACIGGQPAVLRAGNSSVIVGGDPTVVERLRPHLALLGTVYHVGPIGAGNTTKMMHNLVNGAHRMVISEALQIGRADGVSAAALLEVLRHDTPAWFQSEDSFDPGPGLTFNRNLVEQILPPIERLTDELGSEVPITKLLINLAKVQEEAASEK
jgi:3-hydroxyisobutyrate dehydrogenase-like beta-hydroxyacid dehydrogenase